MRIAPRQKREDQDRDGEDGTQPRPGLALQREIKADPTGEPHRQPKPPPIALRRQVRRQRDPGSTPIRRAPFLGFIEEYSNHRPIPLADTPARSQSISRPKRDQVFLGIALLE